MTTSFVDYLKEKLPLVEAALAESAASPMAVSAPMEDLDLYLYAPLSRFTNGGGKRVRPVLAMLGAEAVGGKGESALSAGLAIELFQSAALIHDDIADKSELRRGEPCLYVSEGTGPAINMGDLALTQVFEVVLADNNLSDQLRVQVLQELVGMERHTLEGQALDLGWARDERWDISALDYIYMVASKTAWYSAAYPLSIGALVGGGNEKAREGLSDLGIHAGIAFQLQDDVLNLVGSAKKQGKDFRSDITEGKRTLAVIAALDGLSAYDSKRLIDILESHTTDEHKLEDAVALIEKGGGIEYCKKMAKSEASSAQAKADELLSGHLITKDAHALLQSMADYFIKRAR